MSMPPVAGTARIIAKLLSSRPTHQHEIPDLIEGVHTALAQLGESREPAAAETSTAPDKGEASGRRRRHRAAFIEPATEAAAPPPAPKLLRRAEVVAPGTSEVSPLLAPRGAVRGIVKWFDAQNRRGALRLPGCGGDVPVNAATLAEAGIGRLYKGQEIEATLEGPPETPRLLRVALPGGAGPTATPGIVRGRHAKLVVVELKRDGVRRAAARAEAEQLLRPPRPR